MSRFMLCTMLGVSACFEESKGGRILLSNSLSQLQLKRLTVDHKINSSNNMSTLSF